MTAMTLDPSLSLQVSSNASKNRVIVEEIDGLIRVYKDGHVERPQIMTHAACSSASEFGVSCRDVIIDKYTNIWARFYVPNTSLKKLPLLVYFHGGGFCVGSASWSCYHEFLAKLSSKTGCVIVSVNHRLAPEYPLPAAYEDGVKALIWLRQQSLLGKNEWWTNNCNISKIFLAGDSAGANIAFNVSIRLARQIDIKGLILIQPFFGGESRTHSEKYMMQPPRSTLTLAASDTYWRLSLPPGENRDHPWCNPMAQMDPNLEELRDLSIMVCISEMDILKDRNLELCAKLGQKVERIMYEGVGHAFQILNKSTLAQTRIHELTSHIKNFVHK
ncbi:probable carboxylesterase 6 [Primulina huaijiensis]|uniref:probable carboxylesterase 6 n=1 Tax=Primulina huaijiensis TaxID=1492673 RepID=UPI003CC79341